MGKSSEKRKNIYSSKFSRSKKKSISQKSSKNDRVKSKHTKEHNSSVESGASSNDSLKKKKSSLGGRMDSKHFPSRSTTDNLPSSLSTPGERAGLTSASPTAVDASSSVATSSTNTNNMSAHLTSSCSTSGPADISSHSASASSAETEVDARLPPDTADSEISLSSSSDKSYDPMCDSNVCSSSSCSSLPSSLSAVISSSSKGHEEHLGKDYQGNSVCSNDSPVLPQNAKNSVNSSVASNNGQTIGNDPGLAVANSVVSSSSNNKDSHSVSETPDDQSKEGLSSSTLNATSHPVSGLLTSKSNMPKDSKPCIEDDSPLSPLSRGVKRTHDEIEEPSESSSSPKSSPQKNKKRCFVCSSKLELAQRTIGKCRCERVFCPMHRLPELHDCEFNHKEDGRREAREKMVKPTRHMGTSFRRDDQT